jgi:hypothetical protein
VKKISARLLFIVKVFLLGGETMRRLELEEQDVDIINQADKIMHKGTLISCLIDGDCRTLALLANCSAYIDSALSLNLKKKLIIQSHALFLRIQNLFCNNLPENKFLKEAVCWMLFRKAFYLQMVFIDIIHKALFSSGMLRNKLISYFVVSK